SKLAPHESRNQQHGNPKNLTSAKVVLAIRFGPPPANSELVSRVIARSFGQLCAASSYLESHDMPMSPEDLVSPQKACFQHVITASEHVETYEDARNSCDHTGKPDNAFEQCLCAS
ncbi:hypothetical protein, partial [Gluconobacter cerinus]